jgi:hypothetical protein
LRKPPQRRESTARETCPAILMITSDALSSILAG